MENGKGCHAVGLSNGVGLGSTEFHVLRARGQNNPRFIFHWTRAPELRHVAKRFMIGSAGQQRVQTHFFIAFPISAIDPMEQWQIGRILDAVDDAIFQTEALIAKFKNIKAGLLHDFLTRGIDDNGDLRDLKSRSNHVAIIDGSPMPRGWTFTNLGSLGEWHAGGTPRKSVPRYWDGTIPWLTPKDMKVFRIEETTDYLTALGSESGTCLMPADAVFIVVRGMILAHTFPVCICGLPMAFNQDVRAIVANDTTNPLFLAYWLLGNSSSILRLSTESTHGTKRFDVNDLRRHSVALPPKPEQDEISKRLEKQREQIWQEGEYLDKLRNLKAGLMHDLLNGNVRVTALETAQ
jgi:type I restriction enzyme S subunit